jgi:hypothetical protein
MKVFFSVSNAKYRVFGTAFYNGICGYYVILGCRFTRFTRIAQIGGMNDQNNHHRIFLDLDEA